MEHYDRWYYEIPETTGDRNHNWKGGVSEYPHHGLMKHNRLVRLREAKNKCETCGKEAYCIHHIDGSKNNHELSNLAVLCRSCHNTLHAGDDRIKPCNKFSRLYGIGFAEMIATYGGSYHTYYRLHRKGILKEELNNLEKMARDKP